MKAFFLKVSEAPVEAPKTNVFVKVCISAFCHIVIAVEMKAFSLTVSEAPVEAPKAKKYDSYNPDTYKTDEMKKEEVKELSVFLTLLV